MRYSLFLILLLGVFMTTCGTDDSYMPETDYKFPFELNTTLDSNYYANESGYIKVKPEIDQLNKNIALDYKFSIEVLGDKTLRNNIEIVYDNRSLIQGQDYTYNKEHQNFEFRAKEIGLYPIQFTFENQYGFKVVHTENLDITQLDFTVDLGKDVIYPLISKQLKLDIESLDDDKANKVTYKYNYEFALQEQAQGVVVVVDGKQISEKENINYSSKDISFTFPKSGEYEIIFNVVSSQGKKVTKKEILKVDDVQFDFEFKEQGKLNPNTKILFKLKIDNITEDILQKYKLKIEYSSPSSPLISYNSTLLSKDVFYNVVGEDLYITFSNIGEYSFSITLENQYGYQVKKEMYYNVSYANFTILTKDFPNKVYLNDEVNYSITPVVDKEDQGTNMEYYFKVKYPKGVVIEYEDKTLVSDTYVKYNSSKIKAVFKEKGIQEIVYFFKNSQGLEVSSKENIDIKVSNFEIDVAMPKHILVGKKFSIDFEPKALENAQENISYDFKIMSDKGVGIYYNGYQISLDNYTKYQSKKIELLFNEKGDYNLSIMFKNSQGIEITRKIIISVGYSDYEIKTENIPNKIDLKEKFSIGLIPTLLDEALNTEGLTYDFKVQANEGVTVYYNNYQLPINTYQKYDQSEIDFIFTEKGQQEVTFTFKNSQGLEVVKKVVFIVQMTNFEIKFQNLPKDILLNKEYDFNVIPQIKNEEDKRLTLEYDFKVQSNKGVEISYNGYQVPINTNQKYSSKDFKIKFTEPGQHDISYTFKSSQGLEIVEKISFLVKLNEYSIEIENMPKSIYINTNTLIDFFPKNITGEELTYQFKIDAPKTVQASYNGYQIPLNSFMSFNNKSLDLMFSESGQQEVLFTFKSSQGLEISRKVVFVVLRAEFDVKFENIPRDILLNKEYDFNVIPQIKNEEDKDLKIDYTFKAQANKGVELYYNGYPVQMNTNQSYSTKDFKVKFTEPGQYEIAFAFKSSQGVEVVEKTTFIASLSQYSVEVENMPKSTYLNTNTLIDVLPKSSTGEELSYQFKIDAPKAVQATYNGYQIPLNSYTSYNSKNFDLKFTEPGQQEVTFTFKSSQGLEVSRKIMFVVLRADYEVKFENLPKDIQLNKDYDFGVFPQIKNIEDKDLKIDYTFKVQANKGVELYYNGYQIPINTNQSYSSKNFKIRFTEPGQQEVTFTFKSSQGLEVIEKTTFIASLSQYSVEVENMPKEVFLNTNATIDIFPKSSTGEALSYQFKVYAPKSVQTSYNGYIIPINTYTTYANKSIDFRFTEPGQQEVTFTFKSSQGLEITKTLIFTIKTSEFDIIVSDPSNDISINKKTAITVEPKILENNQPNISYQVKVQANSNSIVYYDGGYQMPINTYQNYTSNKFEIEFKEKGQHEVSFYLKNSQGIEVRKRVLFNVTDLDFEIDIKNLAEQILPKTELPFKIKPILNNSTENVKYTYKIKSDKSNVLIKNGDTSVIQNYDYEYKTEDFLFSFPTDGTYIITVDMTNNYGGVTSKALQVHVIGTDFEIEINEQNPIYVGEQSPLEVKINSKSVAATYKIKYDFQGGGGDVIDVKQNGNYIYSDTFIQYKSNPFIVTYPRAGSYVLTITIEDNYGKIKILKKQVIVLANSFKSTISVDKNKLFIGEKSTATITLEKKPSNQKVYAKILGSTFDKVGLTYGNQAVNFDNQFELNGGKIQFAFKEIGVYNLTIELNNDTGYKELKTVSFEVTNIDYNTTLNLNIPDTPLKGYETTFYANPVNLRARIQSLANFKDLKIRFKNSQIITINDTFVADQFFNVSSLDANYSIKFTNTANGQEVNNVTVEILEPNGNIISSIINVPVNRIPSETFIPDFSSYVNYDKSSRDKGYRINQIWITRFNIDAYVKIKSVVIEYDFTTNHYYAKYNVTPLKVSENKYEIELMPDPAFEYYENSHNDDRGTITVTIEDELNRIVKRTVPIKIY